MGSDDIVAALKKRRSAEVRLLWQFKIPLYIYIYIRVPFDGYGFRVWGFRVLG